MKSLFRFVIPSVFILQLTSCQLSNNHEKTQAPQSDNSPLVDPKYSLSKDRSEFDKLRESVPATIKQTNDESALMAEWFAVEKYSPEQIRDKFDTLIRKKRDLFNKDMTKIRENYNKAERKKREEFLKELENDRKDFLEKKVDREKKNDFFNDQDENRRTYFAEQKEKRDDFESNQRETRKNYEDYLKEKTDDFNSELKSYRLKWKEKKSESQ